MKKLMTVLMVLALAGVANAALENFETYSTTSNFETAGAADWTFEPDPPDAEGNQKHLIVLDSANKVYRQEGHRHREGGTEGPPPISGFWEKSIPAASASSQTLTYDFNLTDSTSDMGFDTHGDPGFARSLVQYENLRNTPGNLDIIGHIDIKLTNGSFTYGYLYTNDGGTADLPGNTGIVMDTWYTLEMEVDFDANKTRARFGLRGGTPNGWTGWRNHKSDFTAASGDVRLNSEGGVLYDNLTLIPEPVTLSILALGGLATLLRRRR